MLAANKTVVREYFAEVINHHNLAAIDKFVDPDIWDHSVRSGLLPKLECTRQLAEMYFRAFPDLLVTIDDQVTEGDRVVTRWTARGTHQGELSGGIPPAPHLLGLHRVSPSGKEVIISGVAVDRISKGKIIEHFGVHDSLGLMQQIGAVPTTT